MFSLRTSAICDQTDSARIAELLGLAPRAAEHAACGVTGRPCRDCRRTATLDCLDSDTCAGAAPVGSVVLYAGRAFLCRPCAAALRCRLWRSAHPLHVRQFHVACERYPALARLHPDPATAAAIWHELRRAAGSYAKRVVRRMLVRELPEAVRASMED